MYKFILRLFGWKINPEIPKEYDRCVLIGAPHPSNWDFLFSVLSFKALKIPYKFTIKKQWFRFPFNLIIKPIGGLPIDTKGNSQKGISNVDTMASFFSLKEKFVMAITPEGTRSLKKEWKSGFYHVAKKANVPICLAYLDYKNKIAGVGKVIFPTDNMAADMKMIMDFYKEIVAKFPHNFSTDLRYS